MRHYILAIPIISKEEFLKLEDLAFTQATKYNYTLYQVLYSKFMKQNIYLSLS